MKKMTSLKIGLLSLVLSTKALAVDDLRGTLERAFDHYSRQENILTVTKPTDRTIWTIPFRNSIMKNLIQNNQTVASLKEESEDQLFILGKNSQSESCLIKIFKDKEGDMGLTVATFNAWGLIVKVDEQSQTRFEGSWGTPTRRPVTDRKLIAERNQNKIQINGGPSRVNLSMAQSNAINSMSTVHGESRMAPTRAKRFYTWISMGICQTDSSGCGKDEMVVDTYNYDCSPTN